MDIKRRSRPDKPVPPVINDATASAATSPINTAPRRRSLNAMAWIRKRLVWIVIGLVVIAVVVAAVIWFMQRDTQPKQVNNNPAALEYQKQLPDLRQKVKESPDDPSARKNYGIALYATGDYKEAKKQYEQAVELNDKDAVAYNNLANTYRDLGDINKAIEAYRRAIEIDPKQASSYANLANIQLYTQDKPDEAIATYQKGIKALPANDDLQMLLGIAYESRGDIDKAKQAFTVVIERSPDNTGAQANLDRLNKK